MIRQLGRTFSLNKVDLDLILSILYDPLCLTGGSLNTARYTSSKKQTNKKIRVFKFWQRIRGLGVPPHSRRNLSLHTNAGFCQDFQPKYSGPFHEVSLFPKASVHDRICFTAFHTALCIHPQPHNADHFARLSSFVSTWEPER